MEGPDRVPADAASAVIDFTHRIHQALVGIYGEEAERILLDFRDELHGQIEKNSQVESACRDGLQLAISTHVPVAAGHARLLQGLIETRSFDNASAGAGGRETQAAATFKRSDERLQAIARINVAWGKDILQHYKFDEIGRTTAVCLAQVAQLYPDWSRAVQRINAAMLSRHISSVADNGQRIGDHHSTSNVKDRNRPIEAVDAKLVVEWRRQGIVELAGVRVADADNDLPQEPQRAIDEWTTCETTATNSHSSDSFESNAENEHEALPQDLAPHSSFFEEEYDATMAGRSPQLFSHNCPSCIGPCLVGRAPKNWTGVELDLLHTRLLGARYALEEMPSVTDTQSAAWVDGFHGANIFFESHVLQSCEKSDADAYSFTLDALKCLAEE
ncbi:hypothetical protein MBLNU13_g09821t2 [Cladosporium sp. NU13]